ncbi:MAG: hypothetical protein HN742_09345 [Lentisphaerae bacterium]|nr:hypothetical protein [Lentisphaerota bacterium]MBT5607443.1 hypothetical protein [Lentisphaerota bacterium]MBT7054126.1 hypothetical protein [Lentisphaerota bacterium]MBT7842066.1 hypothetical protein [Lentisphaerota bacterium]
MKLILLSALVLAIPCSHAALQARFTPAQAIEILDGDQAVFSGEKFTLFKLGPGQVSTDAAGELKCLRVTHETDAGSLTREAVVAPGQAWLIWRVRAKTALRGQLAIQTPTQLFPAPYVQFYAINQQDLSRRDEIRVRGSTYCIVAGPEGKHVELQCGTDRKPDWRFTARGETHYRYHASLSLAAGDEWTGVVRFIANTDDPYPQQGFDFGREERGILPSLLTDAVMDGFTIVPTRSTRYTLSGKPLTVRLKCYAIDQRERRIRITYKVTDMRKDVVRDGTVVLNTGGKLFAMSELPLVFEANGAYRMEIGYAAGGVSRTRELVFTVLPEVEDTGFRTDSIFGASVGWGEYTAKLANRVGIKWTRTLSGSGNTSARVVVPERGTYRFDMLDEQIAIHRRNHILGFHNLCDTAKWLRELWEAGDFDAYLRAYVDEYVIPTATHAKGRITYWEVSNEPYYTFRACPEKYVALVKACYEALKAVDPENTVVSTCGPPGSMGYSWYRRTFALGSLAHQDGVSCHLYAFGPWVGSGLGLEVRKWMHDIRGVMAEHGRVLPLWNSETALDPPSCLYRHPSHSRYYFFHPGKHPSDPVEMAQMYFRTLVVHKAENVFYSFHIFHGGTECQSHTAEYDETPLGFLATQAALAKHLEGATYVEDVSLHEQLQVFLFKRGRRLTVIPWGPEFLKSDSSTVVLPVPASAFTARDVFDNPFPVAGDAQSTTLKVTWEGQFLSTETLSLAQLRQAFSLANVEVNMAPVEAGTLKGHFFGEPSGAAKRAHWVGYQPVDLSTVVNRDFRDDTPEDFKGGWTDEGQNDMRNLPPGDWLVNGVPFRILDAAQNGGKSCLILKGGPKQTPFPETTVVPLPGSTRLSKLHVLHTVTWGYGKVATPVPSFRYVMHYEDGFKEEFKIACGREIADWWWGGRELPGAKPGWEGPNPVRAKVCVWHATHEITHPKGAQAVMDRIEIITENRRPIPVVIAITGVHSN